MEDMFLLIHREGMFLRKYLAYFQVGEKSKIFDK